MDPAMGRALWQMLHGFAKGYPATPSQDSRIMAMTFLASFRDSLMRVASGTCSCRTTLAAVMREFPVDLTSRTGFIEWTEALHDLVNLKLGKPRFKPALQHPMLTPEGLERVRNSQPPPPAK